MVKFQKQMEEQIVPEWKESYVNYKQLKKDINRIKEILKKQNTKQDQGALTVYKPKHMHQFLLRSFTIPSIVIGKLSCFMGSFCSQEKSTMVVHQRRAEHCETSEDLYEITDDFYETELSGRRSLMEPDCLFFERLDGQLNMINRFHKCKEEEHITWASHLYKQLEALEETRKAFNEVQKSFSGHININLESHHCGGNQSKSGEKVNKIKTKDLRTDEVYNNKRQIRQTEKILRKAFMQFYKSLGQLKSYSLLNLAAFGKILKKYDKKTGQRASKTYLRVVESSHFVSSDKVLRLMEKVESLFTEHFTKNNRREALAFLKPVKQNTTQLTTFFLGIFSGCSVSLIVVLIFMATLGNEVINLNETDYMKYVFSVYSTLYLILLHLYLYGCNVFLWRRVQIKHTYIFEMAPGTDMNFRDIFLLSTGLTSILLCGMTLHLTFNANFLKPYHHIDTNVVPLLILMVFLMILFLPFDFLYKSTRFALVQCLGRIICAPMYKVTLVDFFVADQLTSQVAAFRSLEYIFCYYIGKYYKTHGTTSCTDNPLFKYFQYTISVLPYWWRLMQCIRRWIDERNRVHLTNGGKYLSALVATVIHLSFDRNQSEVWMVLFIISSTFATCYQIYWDLVVDWGLLQPNSVNPWLRELLALNCRITYFFFMGLNSLLRVGWMYSVLHAKIDVFHHHLIDIILASMEIARRGIWNFFRLENEHMKNMQHFKVSRTDSIEFEKNQE